MLLLAASCGVALALWEPSHQVTSPFATASASRSGTASAGAAKVAGPETPVAADAEDDQSTATVKLSTLCSQRATARRDCASVKAVKDARLKAPDPDPASPKQAQSAAKEARQKAPDVSAPTKQAQVKETRLKEPNPVTVPSAAPSREPQPGVKEMRQREPESLSMQSNGTQLASSGAQPSQAQSSERNPSEAQASEAQPSQASNEAEPGAAPAKAATRAASSAAQAQRAATGAKAKRPAPVFPLVDDAPMERLVRVYDHVTPEGRRIPVYRRAGSGRYETGVIVDGEYRPARRANLDPPSGRYFGLQ